MTVTAAVEEHPMIDVGFGPQEIVILGVCAEGVKVHTKATSPAAWFITPPHLITGYRPQDHPELNHAVVPARSQSRLTEAQHLVLNALRAAGEVGMIDDEHEAVNGLYPTSAGKRRLELQRRGYVEQTDKSRLTRRLKAGTVYRITSTGREALIAHDTALIAV